MSIIDPNAQIDFLYVSYMLISDVPTFSSKMVNRAMFVGTWRGLLATATAAACIAFAYSDIWLAYLTAVAVYIASFIASHIWFGQLAARHANEI